VSSGLSQPIPGHANNEALETAAANSWIRAEQADYNKPLGKRSTRETRGQESVHNIARLLRSPPHTDFIRQSQSSIANGSFANP